MLLAVLLIALSATKVLKLESRSNLSRQQSIQQSLFVGADPNAATLNNSELKSVVMKKSPLETPFSHYQHDTKARQGKEDKVQYLEPRFALK